MLAPSRLGCARDFSALALRWCELQPLEILSDRIAKPLAARHGRAAGDHEDEVAARRAADLLHVAHVHEAGAADAQHRLRLEGALGLLQRAARVEDFAA